MLFLSEEVVLKIITNNRYLSIKLKLREQTLQSQLFHDKFFLNLIKIHFTINNFH